MKIYKKETETVEIPFDRYEELILREQKYRQLIARMQAAAYEEDYICPGDAKMLLSMMYEDVFAKEKEDQDEAVSVRDL